MSARTLHICAGEATLSLLRWIVRESKTDVNVRPLDSRTKLESALDSGTLDVLITDTDVIDKPMVEFAKFLHNQYPTLKTVLIVHLTEREAVMEIIRENLVKGVIVKPFTAEVVSNYLDRLLH